LPLLLSSSSCNVLSLDVSSFDVSNCDVSNCDVSNCDVSSNWSNLLKCLFLICETSTKVMKATKEKKMKKWTKNLRTKWKQLERRILTTRCILIEYLSFERSSQVLLDQHCIFIVTFYGFNIVYNGLTEYLFFEHFSLFTSISRSTLFLYCEHFYLFTFSILF
jgi:hypothetical protein